MKLKLSLSKDREPSQGASATPTVGTGTVNGPQPLSSPAAVPTVPKIKLRAPAGPKITLRKPQAPPKDPPSPSDGTPTMTLASKKSKTVLRVKPSRTHGEGWDSEDPDREDDPLIEDGLIIRMLPDPNLDVLRSAADSGELSGISIYWKDKKRAILKIHGDMYGAKLVELPTIVDVHKTLDKKNMFKTIDVCQMLLVVKKITTEREVMDIHVDKEYGETFPDGISPPMEASKYRFTKKYYNRVVQNVEDEVEKLLKLDAEAESSTYEFINPDEENITMESLMESKVRNKLSKKEKKRKRKEKLRNLTPAEQVASAMDLAPHNADMEHLDEELDKLMGDVDLELDQIDDDDEEGRTTQNGEDDDDDDEESDDDDDVAPENAEIPINSEGPGTDASSEDEDDDEEDDYLFNDGNPNDPREEVDETKRHNAIIADEIKELETIIEQKNNDLTKIVNPIMRSRINDVIGKLVMELEMKKKQIVETDKKEEEEDKVDAVNAKKRAEEEDNEGDNEDDDDDEEEDQNEDQEENQVDNTESHAQEHPMSMENMDIDQAQVAFNDVDVDMDIASLANPPMANADDEEEDDFEGLF